MRNILDRSDRDEIVDRIQRLTADARPRWGRMTAEQMICHCRDQVAIALGDREARDRRRRFLSSFIGRKLVLYVVPWRKGKEAAPPEMDPTREGSRPTGFERDRAELLTLLDRFAATPERDLHPHPWLGDLSKRDWGRVIWKNTDHHLRQFGV